MTLLALGRFEEGWPEYEWRWKTKGVTEPRGDRPRWDGSSLTGRTILLQAEQGHGDTLQFIRYVTLLKRQGARIVVECGKSLERLVAQYCRRFNQVLVAPKRAVFDVRLPLMSVPGFLARRSTRFLVTCRICRPAEDAVAAWRQELASLAGFKVGIAWQGNPGRRAIANVQSRWRCLLRWPRSRACGWSICRWDLAASNWPRSIRR